MFDYFAYNNHIYTTLEIQRTALSPLNWAAHAGHQFFSSPLNPAAYTPQGRAASAALEMVERMTRHYIKPEFGITETTLDGREVTVRERIVLQKTFCDLIHFVKGGQYVKKNGEAAKKKPQEKLLIVAPMSGHYATLLRGTVRALLPHTDVYITDWANASDVPLIEGSFDLDDYIDYVQEFVRFLGGDVHLMAVCQPSVPVMAAASLMASAKDPMAPKSMILIGGPIDTRVSPTEVNKVAKERPDIWFERNVIVYVPANYPGFMRLVYPGFIQLSGFMSMNMDRHLEAHFELFQHLVQGDGDSAQAHKEFYNEYLSVMDVTAEFYLQTIRAVFQDHLLPRGKMVSRGLPVNPGDIKKTALLCIEGGKDDISGVGQTKAALKLCSGLPEAKKHYHLQKDVGHYGTFNGRRFREHIVPAIVDFIGKNS